jgi:hypothetical protein
MMLLALMPALSMTPGPLQGRRPILPVGAVVKASKPSMRFAVALPARQDTLSELTFVNGSPALSGTQTK